MGTAESLERARARVELKVLLDHCVITLDPDGFSDDSFDRATLTWTRPPDDDALIYSGPCSIRSEAAHLTDEDGNDVVSSTWIGKLPLLDSAAVRNGAILLVDDSRDPEMIGRTFKVDQVYGGTFKVLRPLRLSSLEPSPSEWSNR